MLKFSTFAFISLLATVATVKSRRVSTITEAEAYLSQYGYLPTSERSSRALIDEQLLNNALQDFQKFTGLNITGTLNEATKSLMSMARCGVRDVFASSKHHAVKRFAFQKTFWVKKVLSYRISQYTNQLPKNVIEEQIDEAFALWSSYIDLNFIRKYSDPVDIDIRFVTGNHGCEFKFDGPGGAVAHAFFPTYGGDIHFDDKENWTTETLSGLNIFQVAVHEIGHSLGLRHSDESNSIMTPFYRDLMHNVQLHADDIFAIQALYNQKPVPDPFTELIKLCNNSKIDAAYTSANGGINILKGKLIYKLKENSVINGYPKLILNFFHDFFENLPTVFRHVSDSTIFIKGNKLKGNKVVHGYPKLISEIWHGLKGNLDAAFRHVNGSTFFFKGDNYWRYTGLKMDPGFPKALNETFKGVPNHVDAVLYLRHRDHVYLFKDNLYWVYFLSQNIISHSKNISDLGFPVHLDAAFVSEIGDTYMFKDDKYYRYISHLNQADPQNPYNTSKDFFECQF